MFLLKHLFRLRERVRPQTPDTGDMPLLDHLEDLRRTIIAMGVTILVSTLLCFGFSPWLMQVLSHPAQDVQSAYTQKHLPGHISPHLWKQALQLFTLRPSLSPQALHHLEQQLGSDTCALADALALAQAASLLPDAQQAPFVHRHAPHTDLATMALDLLDTPLPHLSTHTSPRLMSAFHPGEAFMLSLRLSFVCGLIGAFPLLLYFALRFILPGLLEHERRILYQCIIFGSLLFVGGCAFAYFGVLPRVLAFFYSYSLDLGIDNDWRIGYYLTFAAKLVLVTGAIFELPVILMPLIQLGILNYDIMRRTRAFALVACFAVALFLAPAPDPGTMFLLALPLYLLYETCILLALWKKHHSPS